MIKNLDELLNVAQKTKRKKMVLVNGIDEHSLEAAVKADTLGLIDVMITGDRAKITATCELMGISVDRFLIFDAANDEDAALIALRLVADGTADCIMKGLISTDKYMRALLNKEYGMIGPRGVLSHVTVMKTQNYHKLLFVSDVAIIPFPDVNQKAIMVGYLIQTARRFGIRLPKVALIAATEQILKAIPGSIDAAMLLKMAEGGQFAGGIIAGPMGLDVAVDKESALIKNIKSPVAGDADCLLFPNIEAGNVFYKVNTKLCRSEQAAIVEGARVPAVLSSRGDSVQTKLNSIALAAFMSH